MRLTYAFEYSCKQWKRQKAEDQLRQEEMMKEQEDEMAALSISESSDEIAGQQRQEEESTQEGAPTPSPAPTARLLPQTEAGADEAKEVDGDQKQHEEKVQEMEEIISPTEAKDDEVEKCNEPEKEEKEEAVAASLWVGRTEAKKADHGKDQKQAIQGEEQQRKPKVLATCQGAAMKARRHEKEAEHEGEGKESAPNTFKAAGRKTGTLVQRPEHFISIRVWSTKEKKWTTVQRPTVSQSHVYLPIANYLYSV